MRFTPGWQAFLVFLVSGGGVGTTVYLLRAKRDQIHAETMKVITAAAKETAESRDEWVDRLQTRIDRLAVQLDEAQRANDGMGRKLDDALERLTEVKLLNDRYRQWAKLLTAQLVELGHDPVKFEDVR